MKHECSNPDCKNKNQYEFLRCYDKNFVCCMICGNKMLLEDIDSRNQYSSEKERMLHLETTW